MEVLAKNVYRVLEMQPVIALLRFAPLENHEVRIESMQVLPGQEHRARYRRWRGTLLYLSAPAHSMRSALAHLHRTKPHYKLIVCAPTRDAPPRVHIQLR